MQEKCKRLPVYITVPSYKESFGIVYLLESIAQQHDLDDVHLFVLINNSRADVDKKSDAYKSNILTYALTKAFAAGWKINIKGKIISKSDKLNVHVIDYFSKNRAPEKVNVGKARRVLLEEVKRNHKIEKQNAIVVTLDADEYVSNEFVGLIRAAYIQNRTCGMMELPMCTIIPKNASREEKIHATRIKRFYKLRHAYESLIKSLNPGAERKISELIQYSICTTPTLGGGYSSFLLSSYMQTKGYKGLSGAEDVLLSFDMHKKGVKPIIGHVNSTLVFTPIRESDRTDKDHGMGQLVIRQKLYFQSLKEDLLIGKYIKKMQALLRQDLGGKELFEFLNKEGFEDELLSIIIRNKDALLSFDHKAEIKLDEGIYWIRFAVEKHLAEKQKRSEHEVIAEASFIFDHTLKRYESIIQKALFNIGGKCEVKPLDAKQILKYIETLFDKFCYPIEERDKKKLLFIVQSGVLSHYAELLSSIVFYKQRLEALKYIKQKESSMDRCFDAEGAQKYMAVLHNAFVMTLQKTSLKLINGIYLTNVVLRYINYALLPYKNSFPKELSRLKKAIERASKMLKISEGK